MTKFSLFGNFLWIDKNLKIVNKMDVDNSDNFSEMKCLSLYRDFDCRRFEFFQTFQAIDCRLWHIVKYKNGWRLYWDIFWNKFVIYHSFISSEGIFKTESKQKSSFNLIAVS